jgi:hypothetical protein
VCLEARREAEPPCNRRCIGYLSVCKTTQLAFKLNRAIQSGQRKAPGSVARTRREAEAPRATEGASYLYKITFQEKTQSYDCLVIKMPYVISPDVFNLFTDLFCTLRQQEVEKVLPVSH